MLQRIDQKLFAGLYCMAQGNVMLGQAMVWATKASSRVFYVLYGAFILLLLFTRDVQILPFIIGPAAGLLLTGEIRKLVYRPRPFVALGIKSLIWHEDDSSFPSKHAMSAFVIGMSIWYVSAAWGTVVLGLAVLTGISRVMVGVHYPGDIVVGAVLGIMMSMAAFHVF